jgi:predicted secreted protein
MIASAQICDVLQPSACYATRGYQVAAGATSFGIALICSIVHYAERIKDHDTMGLISVFFFLWWTAAVIVLTYFGDFITTNNANGYFCSWGAFLMSVFSLVAVAPGVEAGLERQAHNVRKPLFYLGISSAVVMGAAIGPCSNTALCNGYTAYALVLSVSSLFFAIILFLFATRVERNVMNFFAVLFLLWWVFGTAVVTLGGPFQNTGNGYFGSFAALFSSMYFVRSLSH